MISLALDPQAVASAWQRVGTSIFSDPLAVPELPTAIKLDLVGVEASLGFHQPSCSNTIDAYHLDGFDNITSIKAMNCDADLADPVSSWNSMMPMNLSGNSSCQAASSQQPASSASDGNQAMRVPECVATSSSKEADASTALEPAASAGTVPASAHHCNISSCPAVSSSAQPQLSRANSLSAVVPDAPNSPQGPAHSSSSDSSCADVAVSTAATAATSTTSAVVPEVTVVAAASRESSPPLSPRAAMAAAAAAATAAMQKRLMEQQKMGKHIAMPGVTATASNSTATAPPAAPVLTTATAVQPAAPSLSTKRSYNAMMHGWAKPVAGMVPPAVAARPPVALAAAAAAIGELFVRTRAEALTRYREKRARRTHVKKIRYHLRKVNADKRPRIKGRFVSKEEMEKLGLLVPEFDEQAISNCKHTSVQEQQPAANIEAETAAAATEAAVVAGGSFSWEEQMQQMHLMGSDMATELLMKYDDVDHHMQLPTAADAAAAAAACTPTDGSTAAAAAAEQLLLHHELDYAAADALTSPGVELPGFGPMDLAGVSPLPLHFGEDFLNDEASNMSHGHHDLLML